MMRQVNNQVLFILAIIAIAAAFSTLNVLWGGPSITGLYSGTTNITVVRLAAIDILVSLVDFHNMVQDSSNDTSNYSPHPFVIQNNGTTFVNITIYSEDLWPSAKPNPTMWYRYNASDDNATNTAQSTIQLGWVSPWTDMPASAPSNPNLATCINNSPNANTINVHINISVPTLAAAGTHTATVTFTGVDPGSAVCGAGT